MASFKAVMDQIIATLIADVGLNTFAVTNLGKPFTVANVTKMFKSRPDILVGEFPLIMITRPQANGEAESTAEGTYLHTVRLYIGFMVNDRLKAQDILIQMDEFIENAIMTGAALWNLVDFISPASYENDEGYNHPAYFCVKEFQITRGTTWN